MSYLSKCSSRVEALLRSGRFRAKNSSCRAYSCSWSRIINSGHGIASVTGVDYSATSKFGARFYSAKKKSEKKSNPEKATKKDKKKVNDEEEAFYVVRKGDSIGLYGSLDDCQAQVGSSICSSPVSVFKGYGLPKNTAEFLAARGLRNAIYSINAVDFKDGLFGTLEQCSSLVLTSDENASEKRSQLEAELQTEDPTSDENASIARSEVTYDEKASKTRSKVSYSENASNTRSEQLALNLLLNTISTQDELAKRHAKLTHPDMLALNYKSCILKFDGACKGNPTKSGAGIVLQACDGSLICTRREGCGSITVNECEYRALRLGLQCALEKGYDSISIQGDSKLVCMQVLGLWKTKNKNMARFLNEVLDLMYRFCSFQLFHVVRALNSDADAVANNAVTLYDGEIVEETPD